MHFVVSHTDSGLWFGQWNKLLLCQWLCRLLHARDLDGPAHLAAHAAHFCVWLAYDNATKHHGSLRRPQRPIHFSASVRVKHSQCTKTHSPVSWVPSEPFVHWMLSFYFLHWLFWLVFLDAGNFYGAFLIFLFIHARQSCCNFYNLILRPMVKGFAS